MQIIRKGKISRRATNNNYKYFSKLLNINNDKQEKRKTT